jgi:hypothetical protein
MRTRFAHPTGLRRLHLAERHPGRHRGPAWIRAGGSERGVAAIVSVLALAVVVCAQPAATRTQRTGHESDAEPHWWATFERELPDCVERGRQR